jgi:hypothetical protein
MHQSNFIMLQYDISLTPECFMPPIDSDALALSTPELNIFFK